MDGVKAAIVNSLRTKVSGEKHRFRDGTFDLDLTYITTRILAMSFPAVGVEATYRNPIDSVAAMLNAYHRDHYCVYNLTERVYDSSMFYKARTCGWPDHTAPTLGLLMKICIEIDAFLSADPQNVVVIHCLAGKGRTGSVIAAYLLFCELFTSAVDAMDFFALRRSANNWGVCVPSQRRYVRYVSRVLEMDAQKATRRRTPAYVLKEVMMSCVPSFDKRNGCAPVVEVVDISDPLNPTTVFASDHSTAVHMSTHGQPVVLPVQTVVRGDCIVYIKHASLLNQPTMLSIQFHTAMLRSTHLQVTKGNADVACNDSRFCHQFYVQLVFGPRRVPDDELVKLGLYSEPKWDARTVCGGGGLPFSAKDSGSLQDLVEQARSATKSDSGSKKERGAMLVKQGDTFRKWKNRWVVLKEDAIMYYRSPKRTSAKGAIPLQSIIAVTAGKERSYSFVVSTAERMHRFGAHDSYERDDWMDAINAARKALDGPSRSSISRLSSVFEFDVGLEALQVQVVDVHVPRGDGNLRLSSGGDQIDAAELANFSIVFELAGVQVKSTHMADAALEKAVYGFDTFEIDHDLKVTLVRHEDGSIAQHSTTTIPVSRLAVDGNGEQLEGWYNLYQEKKECVAARICIRTTLVYQTSESDEDFAIVGNEADDAFANFGEVDDSGGESDMGDWEVL